MDPFFVLDLGPDATDAAVEARYRELLGALPPDGDSARFATLRRAYEALRTERGRIDAWLFHFDRTGDALLELPAWLGAAPRRPIRREDLRALVLGEP